MKATPELSVDVHSDLVVVTPNLTSGRRDEEDHWRPEPSHDSTVRGTVRLFLSRDSKIKRITVELVRPASVIVSRQALPSRVLTVRGGTPLRIPPSHPQLGRQEITVKGVYHTYDTLRKALEVDVGDAAESGLSAGQHKCVEAQTFRPTPC